MQPLYQRSPWIYPRKNYPFSASSLENIDNFENTKFRIALQKNGELTDLSKKLISSFFGIKFPKAASLDRRLLMTVAGGEICIFFAKNTDVCYLVDIGYVDSAVVGIDSIVEYKNSPGFKIIKDLSNYAKWPLVLATPTKSNIHKVSDIRAIVTQYPRLVRGLLDRSGMSKTKIIPVKGSCEGMVYLSSDIDAVVDLLVTGNTLKDNGLIAWDPPLIYLSPVVIANKNSLKDSKKKKYFDQIYKN